MADSVRKTCSVMAAPCGLYATTAAASATLALRPAHAGEVQERIAARRTPGGHAGKPASLKPCGRAKLPLRDA